MKTDRWVHSLIFPVIFSVVLPFFRGSCALADERIPPSATVSSATPESALRQLAAGNARFRNNATAAADALPKLSTDPDRLPVATIFYSSDMPKTPEALVNLAAEDVYTVPVRAGAISADEMADLEYGVINLQTPLVVLLTHYPNKDVERVVKNFDKLAAKAEAEMAKVSTDAELKNSRPTHDDDYLYALIGPAVARAKGAYPDKSDEELANIVTETIAWQSIEAILTQSDATVELINAGDLNVVAAMADDTSGQIYWLGTHPLQAEFLKEIPADVNAKKESGEAITAADMTAPLSETEVIRYVNEYQTNNYYTTVTNEYYREPVVYQPSCQVFYPRVWCYRPWYGCWNPYYTPWPYYDPWYYGYYPYRPCYFGGGIGFGIGFACGLGIGIHIGPAFHPYNPYWGRPCYLNPPMRPGWHHGGPRDRYWNHAYGPGHGPGSRPGGGDRPGGGPGHGPGAGPSRPGPGGPGGPGFGPGDRPGDRPGGGDRPNGSPGAGPSRPGGGDRPSGSSGGGSGSGTRPSGPNSWHPGEVRDHLRNEGPITRPGQGGRPGSGGVDRPSGINPGGNSGSGSTRPGSGITGRPSGGVGQSTGRPGSGGVDRPSGISPGGNSGSGSTRPGSGVTGRPGSSIGQPINRPGGSGGGGGMTRPGGGSSPSASRPNIPSVTPSPSTGRTSPNLSSSRGMGGMGGTGGISPPSVGSAGRSFGGSPTVRGAMPSVGSVGGGGSMGGGSFGGRSPSGGLSSMGGGGFSGNGFSGGAGRPSGSMGGRR